MAAWLVLNSDLLVSEDDLRDRDRLIEATDHGLKNYKDTKPINVLCTGV